MMLKLTVRGLAAHRMRTALTVVAVLLGAAFVAGTLIFSATLDRTIHDAFTELSRDTDTVVRPRTTIDGGPGARVTERSVPASLRAAVAGLPEVAKAHGQVQGFAAVVDPRGRVVGAEPQTGLGWTADPSLSPMRLTSGRGPDGADEIALDRATAQEAGYRIGSRVPVVTRAGTRSRTLTGIFRYGESALGGSISVIAFPPATAERLLMARPGTYRQIVVQAADGVSQQELRDAVARVLPPGYEAVTGEQLLAENLEPIEDVLAMLRTLLLAFALISVFVGAFIIFNTFAMLVAQRTRELALLRAVGASRRQVTRAVLGEAAGIGLLGSTLGLAAGVLIARLLGLLLGVLLGGEVPVTGLVVPASAVLASYATGMAATLVTAYLPARRAARIPPVTAMREETAPQGRQSLRLRTIAGAVLAAAGAACMAAGGSLQVVGAGAAVAFLGALMLGPVLVGLLLRDPSRGGRFGRASTLRLSRSNARRNPRRTAATAAALMVGMALIGLVSVLTQSLVASVDRQLTAGLTADFRITPRGFGAVAPAVADAVAAEPGVRSALAIRTAPIRLDGREQQATAGDPAQLVAHYRLRLVEGTAQGLVLNRTLAGGRHAGDTVGVEYEDGTTANVRIAGIAADVATATPTVPPLIMDLATYRKHYPDTQLAHIDLVLAPDAASSSSGMAATRRALEARLAAWPNLELKDRAAIKDDYSQNIDLAVRMVLALLALSILIAALGIVNTLALSVAERTREIGLLRAVGMQRRQLRRMIRYEAVLISIFGATLGLVYGMLAGIALQRAMTGVTVLAVPVARLGGYLAAAAVIGVIAAAWPARRAARLDILRAIGRT